MGRTTSVLITELKIIFHATESIESNPVALILFTIFTRDRIEKKKAEGRFRILRGRVAVSLSTQRITYINIQRNTDLNGMKIEINS